MKKSFSICAFFLLFNVSAQQMWLVQTQYPSGKRQFSCSFVLANKIFVGLGSDSMRHSMNDFWSYDIDSNIWKQLRPFNGLGRLGVTTFILNGNAFFVGGYYNLGKVSNEVWKYLPSSDSWIKLNDFPGLARWNAITFTINNKVYLGTGQYPDSGNLADLWEYDAVQDKWTSRKQIPLKRSSAVAFSVGAFGYIATGWDSAMNSNKYYNDIWQYNPTADSWTKKADLPGSQRWGAVAASDGAFGYVGMGSSGTNFLKDFWQYDPINDLWLNNMNDLVYAASGSVSASVGGRFYVGLGFGNGQFQEKIYRYSRPLSTPEMEIENMVNIYPVPSNGQIFVASRYPIQEINIINSIGQKVNHESEDYSVGVKKVTIHQSAGIYLIQLRSQFGQFIHRIVIE